MIRNVKVLRKTSRLLSTKDEGHREEDIFLLQIICETLRN